MHRLEGGDQLLGIYIYCTPSRVCDILIRKWLAHLGNAWVLFIYC